MQQAHQDAPPTHRRCIVTSRHPDPEKTPKAAPGLMTCRGHRLKVGRMIAELADRHSSFAAMLTASERAGEPVRSSREPGLNLNDKVVQARDEIRAELTRYVAYVAKARGFTPPANNVPALTTWLLRHVDWLCAQPDADETHDFLDTLARDTYSLANPSGRRWFVLPGVICSAPIACDVGTHDVQRCEGALVACL